MNVRFATPSPGGHQYQLLIRHILEGALVSAGDQEIVYRDQHRETYREMSERINRLAGALAMLGTAQGDTVAVMDWDSHRYLEAYFAVPMMGAVLQTVNPRLSPEQLIYCLQSTGASVLIFHHDFAPLVEGILENLPKLRHRIIIADGSEQSLTAVCEGEYEELLASRSSWFDFPTFDENALATTFHTTGTTGNPKAVSFSHRQLVLHTMAMMAALATQPDGQAFRRSDVYMPLTPLFHVHAWGMPYVATMAGVKQVYPGRYEPAMLLKLKQNEDVTFSHCVPTVLQMILDGLGAAAIENVGPWTMIIGGSALSTTLHRAAQSRGIAALAGYGMSETGPGIALARYSADGSAAEGREEALAQSLWPIPLVQASIVDDQNRFVEANGVSQGELVLRAPWLTASYEGDAAASANLWLGGWMHTQDMATIRSDGTIIIRDRLKDVIKSGGEWVSSTQIESLLMLLPSVAEAAVVAVPDLKWGERPYIFVVPAANSAAVPTVESVKSHLEHYVALGKLNRIAVPEKVEFVDRLPRTSVGKIDKKQLRSQTS